MELSSPLMRSAQYFPCHNRHTYIHHTLFIREAKTPLVSMTHTICISYRPHQHPNENDNGEREELRQESPERQEPRPEEHQEAKLHHVPLSDAVRVHLHRVERACNVRVAVVAEDIVHTGAVHGVGVRDGRVPLLRPAWEGTDIDPQSPGGFSKRHATPIPDGIRSLEIARHPIRRGDAHVPDEGQYARDRGQRRPQDGVREGMVVVVETLRRGSGVLDCAGRVGVVARR